MSKQNKARRRELARDRKTWTQDLEAHARDCDSVASDGLLRAAQCWRDAGQTAEWVGEMLEKTTGLTMSPSQGAAFPPERRDAVFMMGITHLTSALGYIMHQGDRLTPADSIFTAEDART